MFTIDSEQTICLTRGDIANIEVKAQMSNGINYIFQPDDIVRLKILEKKNCDNVVMYKDVVVTEETESVFVNMDQNDSTIGEIINKPKEYWYEIELNPDTAPQTIIGYDLNGPKIFRIYPEGSNRS